MAAARGRGGRLATAVGETKGGWKKPPAKHPDLVPDTDGLFPGWRKRWNLYTGSPEYEVAVVGVWIDPSNARTTWDNLRAAVQQRQRGRQEAQNQAPDAQGSWQGGYGKGGEDQEGWGPQWYEPHGQGAWQEGYGKGGGDPRGSRNYPTDKRGGAGPRWKGTHGHGYYSHDEGADTATKDGDQTDDAVTLSSQDVAAAATPLAGKEDDGLIKSAKDFPFPWGEHYLVARIEWGPEGISDIQLASTAEEEVDQEEKNFVFEFLRSLEEGTPLTTVVQQATDRHPNKMEHLIKTRKMWPWRSQCDTLLWMGTLLKKQWIQ